MAKSKQRWLRSAPGAVVAATAASALILGSLTGSGAVADELEPVIIRIASDHSPPPHPAGIAQAAFEERLPEVIPGSELRRYHAGALYTVPEAVEAMSVGDLEMTWGQFGKTAPVDPWMNVVAGPMLLTTPGAMEELDDFETVQMLKERFEDLHGVKIFGTAHISMFVGVGASERIVSPEDFAGKKVRSMGPAENAALEAWRASPVVMAFGDVPPAVETGVIDGFLTSLNGFLVTRDQAPYFTVAGINGIVGDYYWIGASLDWWNSLNEATQDAIETLVVDEIIPLEKQLNWCHDQRILEQYRVEDPAQPGVYVLEGPEQEQLASTLGDATTEWVKANTPPEAHEWVDRFIEEARAAVERNPLGTSELEATDCDTLAHYYD